MKNKELKGKYNKIYEDGALNFFSSNAFQDAITIASNFNWENKRVLDIGCGEGRLALMIAEAGSLETIGVDYSEKAISNANKKFNLPNLKFICDDYKTIKTKFDAVTMEGVMEHFDDPWKELQDIIENVLNDNGTVITSSPSFLNPRGYVWMTLEKLFKVPISLTDLHFICPFDMINFCNKHNYTLEYQSIHQDWGCGKGMLVDLKKRIYNALRDANMDNSRVNDLLDWLSCASEFFIQDENSGAIIVYKITKK